MSTYQWSYGAEGSGLYFTITYDPADGGIFTVTSIDGSFDLNALWFSNGDTTVDGDTKLVKSDNSLNMNGSNTVWDDDGNATSEKIVWDGYAKISDTGLGSEGENKDSFVGEGESITLTLAQLGLSAEDFDPMATTLGVRATSVDGLESGDSIKWVDVQAEEIISNVAPVANDDEATAQEAGGIDNTIAGINPTGNVISENDTDEDVGSLQVTAVRTGAEGDSGTDGTVGVALQGLYGMLTLNDDGSYTYEVDQDNTDVQEMTPEDSLTEDFTYTITDNGGLSDSATLTITINGQNDAAEVSVNGEGSFIIGASSPELIDNTIGISDVDNTTLEGAVVAVDDFAVGDTLHFTDQSTISGSYNAATGVLTLSGTATLEDYRAALESITFSTTSGDTTDRTISYVLNDGTHDSAADTGTMEIVVLGADPNDGADNPDTVLGATNLGAGNQTFNGSGGTADNVAGGAGDDTLNGNNGPDTLYGGSGDDTLNGGTQNDLLYGDSGNDSLDGGNGADTLHGGSGNDTLLGDNVADLLYGDAGNDSLQGGNGDDTLYGGSGNDIIAGNGDDDIIYGGFGADALTGGDGVDTFVFASLSDRKDAISDFNPAEDVIDITEIFDDLGLGGLTREQLEDGRYLLLQAVDADSGGSANDVRILVDADGSDVSDPSAGPIAPVVLVDVTNTALADLNNTNLLV